MLILDLRWLLFGFLLTVIAAGLLAIWWERRQSSRRGALTLDIRQVQAALDLLPVGLLVLEDSTCRYANAQARRLLGLVGPAAGPLPEEVWVSLLDEDREAARREVGVRGHDRRVLLAPDRAIHWWIIPWEGLAADSERNRDFVVLLDITAQQRADQLLSDLSHELRTPLATILTHLEILLLPDISTEIGQQSLHLLKREARRMARLVNDMLELGRLEAGAEVERRPVDLLGVVQETIAQIAPQAQKRRMSITLEADVSLPFVIGDEYRLRQVFLNLLDNVVKHCRPGDRATVSLQRSPRGLACAVCDNGPGIAAQHLPHVTRRFYRGTPQGEGGSGLGLSLVAEILRRHDSHLEIDSRSEGDETGTCARFVLPVLPGEEEQ